MTASPCFANCGKPSCLKLGCIRVYDDWPSIEACPCYAGNQTACPIHGPLANTEVIVTPGTTNVEFKAPNGIITADDAVEYMLVVEGAWNVHLDRESIRKGLWKDYPSVDQFNQVKIKVDRILRSLEQLPDGAPEDHPLAVNIREEAYDIINYAIFGVRQL